MKICTASLRAFSALFLACLLVSCGGGGSSGSTSPPPPIDTDPQLAPLTWDQGDWDEVNWQ